MNWTSIISIAVILYILYVLNQIDKRLKRLEEDKGLGFSYSFSVNATDAIFNHPKLFKESKIKSAILGKEYKDWTVKEKEAWSKFLQKNGIDTGKGWVGIAYLTGENGFLVNYRGKTDFFFRGGGTQGLVSEIILGDETRIGEAKLNFILDVRTEKDFDGNYRDFLVCWIEENEGWGKERKAQVLFKFPYNSTDLDENYYKKLGFEVKHEGGEYAGKDALGEMTGIPAFTTYKQNKAEVFICH
jgi:hypothetical protein